MVFVVVPAYNEAKNIGRVIRDLFQHGYKNVVIVDDGSSDDTYIEAKKLGVHVLQHEVNRGQGAALQTGNEFVLANGAEIIVHFDADAQMNSADIADAVEKMQRENLDVVLGSRFLNKVSDMPWTKRFFILPMARLINNIIGGLKLTDVHNGFRVLSRAAAEKIQITQEGMAHNTEIVEQIRKYDLKYSEHPVSFVYNEYGQGVGGGVKILRDLIINKIVK